MRNPICLSLVLMAGVAYAGNVKTAPIPTFNRDVAPILYKNCSNCHRPGEVAPFALLTYEDAAKRAKQIAAITQARVMPPWKATPGYGDFLDVRRLTEAADRDDTRLGRCTARRRAIRRRSRLRRNFPTAGWPVSPIRCSR